MTALAHWIHTTTGQVARPSPCTTPPGVSSSTKQRKYPHRRQETPQHHRTPHGGTPSGGVLPTHRRGTELPAPSLPAQSPTGERNKPPASKSKPRASEQSSRNAPSGKPWNTEAPHRRDCVAPPHAMDPPGGALPWGMARWVYGGESGKARVAGTWRITLSVNADGTFGVNNGLTGMIRPRWADDAQTRIEGPCAHGTEAYPFIAQDWVPDFDTTADLGRFRMLR